MAALDFERRTREKVAAAIEGVPECSAPAAEAAREAAFTALQSLAQSTDPADPAEAIRQVCHGAISALLLRDRALGPAAAAILARMVDIAQELHVDTTQMMTWAMEGFARGTLAAPASAVDQ